MNTNPEPVVVANIDKDKLNKSITNIQNNLGTPDPITTTTNPTNPTTSPGPSTQELVDNVKTINQKNEVKLRN